MISIKMNIFFVLIYMAYIQYSKAAIATIKEGIIEKKEHIIEEM